MSRAGLSEDESELNAIENIVLAETKDHADWELIGNGLHANLPAVISRVG
jgi:hypothetical protein